MCLFFRLQTDDKGLRKYSDMSLTKAILMMRFNMIIF